MQLSSNVQEYCFGIIFAVFMKKLRHYRTFYANNQNYNERRM